MNFGTTSWISRDFQWDQSQWPALFHLLSPSPPPSPLSATGPTGYQPTPPQSPEVDLKKYYSLLNPETLPSEFWDNVLDKSRFSVGSMPVAGPTINQPTPPQGPEVDPETHSRLNSEPYPLEFWINTLKGKFKRGISGSDAVNLAQKDKRSRIF